MNRLATLALVPLLLVACGSGNAKSTGMVSAAGAPGAQTVTIRMTDQLTFSPDTVKAKVGALTMTVVNTGLVPHDLEFKDRALGGTPTVNGKKTATLKVVFDKAGTYAFVCTFHPGMTGKVLVS